MNIQQLHIAMTFLRRMGDSVDEILVENPPHARPGYARVLWRRQEQWTRCAVYIDDNIPASLALSVSNIHEFLDQYPSEYSSFLIGGDNGANTPRGN
jgi:hypothetical protein